MNSLDKIKQYMSEGDFRKAIKELDLIISKEPNNAIAFYMRGKSAFIEIQNEKYDNSLEATKSLIYSTIEHDLNKSIEIDPNIIDAYRGLMYLNRVVRNVDKEREFAQILLEKSKETSIDALLILASSYLNNGKDESDFHQAIGFYDDFIKRVDIEDSKMARFERGLCYYNLDILNKADAEANKLIQDFPMYDDAYFLKGIALSKNSINSDFFEDAIFFLNRAVELNNKNYNALYEIAEWHFEKENYRKAIETYDKLLESKNKYNLASLLGKTQAFHDMIIESGEYKENEEINKDLDEAFNLIDKVIEILGDDIKSVQYKYYKGNLYSYKGEIDKAKEEFEKIIKETKDIDDWLYQRISEFYYNYAENKDDYKKSLEYLEKIKDKKTSIYNLMIFVNYELKNYKRIVEICEEFLNRFLSLNNNKDFKDIEENNIYYIRFIYAYSLQMIGSNNYDLIVENYKICLKDETLDKALIYRSIAKIMMYNMDYKYYLEGIENLKLSMQLNDALSYYLYAKELFYGNIIAPCPELAIGLANNSIELDANLECAYIIMGRGYELGRGVEKNENKAFEIYFKANEIAKINNSKCSCSKAALAHCYYNGIGVKKNQSKALSIVKKIAETRGRFSHRHIALLYSYFALECFEGFDLKKALSLFNQTLPHYSDLSVVMTLKRLYKKLGRSKDVKRMIKIEAETLKRTGEFNLNYLRNYIKNFKNFYPIPF
ncbi:sel1 repeat family protein [Brachyspira aalborgi]|uniref:Sel1 repeat family protein n=1 Tax=Brachyspira aalborgi TaxID=29522 RepID=A0AB38PZV2_9SPIR|nr:tetratricopeptide repeat protein [Brachyspira aalborgi]TXJ14703.1 sel1 repeat family protein [Brachyspira aalborgi]TXJ18664.1 sel1 repeat family protein [Brachyspira aalborgi]TXJ24617.1 sel1 repeat family protein [Brachyspira aalborgi]TXJ48597.1 sel1 repeat family protein [Brachyspira aalborgi]